jgi:RimJ/RimL family protein N-acetyltransferase
MWRASSPNAGGRAVVFLIWPIRGVSLPEFSNGRARSTGGAAILGAVGNASSVPPEGTHLELRTARLLLRRWREEDLEPFSRLNADPEVMRHFASTLDRSASKLFVERIEREFEARGFGLWAVEVTGQVPFIGFAGLHLQEFPAHFAPSVEVGWRLARPYWGHGYATEGARAALAFGFDRLGLAEVVSFTVPANTRSRAVMERLGMTWDPADDFDHPSLPEGHPLRRHVLYRIRRPPPP